LFANVKPTVEEVVRGASATPAPPPSSSIAYKGRRASKAISLAEPVGQNGRGRAKTMVKHYTDSVLLEPNVLEEAADVFSSNDYTKSSLCFRIWPQRRAGG
jgi:hypothetical protein